jgi:hypothetical protein
VVDWIRDFYTGRYAQIIVGRYESKVVEVEYLGIP